MENVVEQPANDHNYEDVDNKIYNFIDVDVAAYPLRNAMHDPGPPQQAEDGGALHHPTQLGSPVGFARQELAPTDVQSPTGERLPGGNNMADLDRNVGYVPGALRKDEKDDYISAANICGRLKSYKCHRPSLLRVIAITVVVAALLGAGACVFMFLSSMENKNADPPIKESPNKRMLKSRMVSPALSKMTPAQAWLVTTLPDNTTELPQMADTQPDQSTLLPSVISTDKTGISTNETALQTNERDQAPARPPPVHGDSFGNIHVPLCKKGYRLLVGTCIKLVVSTALFGLINGKVYYHAKLACWMEGATLAMPKTKELDAALRDLVKTEGGNKEHWIGMEDKDRTWYWVNGSKVGHNGYTGWNPGEPNYYRWPPRCGQYWSGRTGYPMWDDEGCLRAMRWFICQHPPS
ncbi:hypothetical protein Bbelb_055410 [Branchiostoma belcheri]|nr:hypothetical protein Bbelb_055410 [Branchiostoma belcheri]